VALGAFLTRSWHKAATEEVRFAAFCWCHFPERVSAEYLEVAGIVPQVT